MDHSHLPDDTQAKRPIKSRICALTVQTNMYALDSMYGMEKNLGRPLYVTVYFMSGLAGSLASFFLTKTPSLGASGAILGLFGATWMFFENNKLLLNKAALAVQDGITQTVAINLIIGTMLPIVDNWCAA
jgi:rhomboid protease GluP